MSSSLAKRLKDLAGADRSSVFPKSWRSAAEARPAAAVATPLETSASAKRMRAAGFEVRYSSIDGLPLPAARHRPESGPRSRSRERPQRSGSSTSSSSGCGEALYFVDALAHRTLARCHACGAGLAEGRRETLSDRALAASNGQQASCRQGLQSGVSQVTFSAAVDAPAHLGFRLTHTRAGEPQVCWAHATEECLSRLGLPALAPQRFGQDVVFSGAVSEVQQAEVFRSLLQPGGMASASPGSASRSAGGSGGSGGASSSATSNGRAGAPASGLRAARAAPRLQVQRWRFAPAASWHSRRGGSSGSAPGTELRLAPKVLQEEALTAMCEPGGSVPLCIICMQEFAAGEEVVHLPCLHMFHAGCAQEWLRRKPVCPLDMIPVSFAFA